jgi:hypothetical protein
VNKETLDVIGVTGTEMWELQTGFPAPDSDWDQFMGARGSSRCPAPRGSRCFEPSEKPDSTGS